jgi:hypothetical protein
MYPEVRDRGIRPGISYEKPMPVVGYKTTWCWDSNSPDRVTITGIGQDGVSAQLDDLVKSASGPTLSGGVLVTFTAGNAGVHMIPGESLFEFVLKVVLIHNGFKDPQFSQERGRSLDVLLEAIRHGLQPALVLDAILTGSTPDEVLDELFFQAGV